MRCFASPRTWYVSVLTGCTLGMAGFPAVAQGTWYTSKAAWLAAVTSVRTDTFSDSLGRGRVLNRLGGDLQIWEEGPNGTTLYRGVNNAGEGFISVNQQSNVLNLKFNSFAFAGYFGVVDENDQLRNTSLMVTTSDGTPYTLNLSASAGTFLGYLGDAPITWLTIQQPQGNGYVALNSFSLANPAGDFSVAGENVAPEPGTRELVMFGTAAGLAVIIIKRKRPLFAGLFPWQSSHNSS
jgi:hypothetical protein